MRQSTFVGSPAPAGLACLGSSGILRHSFSLSMVAEDKSSTMTKPLAMAASTSVFFVS